MTQSNLATLYGRVSVPAALCALSAFSASLNECGAPAEGRPYRAPQFVHTFFSPGLLGHDPSLVPEATAESPKEPERNATQRRQ
jgi:hypothetical protein